MTDERVDLIITDGIATTIAPKLREIVATASEAHAQLRLMQASVNAIRDSSVKALAKEQTTLTQEIAKQGIAHERLAAAAARTETANARLLLVTGKVNTEAERSALVQARVATENLRNEAAVLRLTQATDKSTAASERRAASTQREGDAAVKLYERENNLIAARERAAKVADEQTARSLSLAIERNTQRNESRAFAQDAKDKEAAAKATEDLAVRSERLRSSVDPLYAAQVRYDRELTEATMLLRAGTISEETHAKAVMASAGALDAATIASKRHAAQTGLTKFQVLTLQYTINDVVASLASGASPMTILMQQGGQVTQAWGGLIPTLKAAGGALFSVYGAVGAGAIGVGALALAYMKGAAEGENFTRSLILTGNAAGMTALQLGETSRVVAERLKTTVSASAAAMNAMVAGGKVPSEQFEMVAAAALRMEKTTGVAVVDTVKQFVELGKDPVKASIALNEQTHFLTAAVWEQIKSLESQGRMSEAGALAQKAWADAIEQRTPAMLASLGSLERGYAKLMSVIKGAASAALEIGRPDTGEADRIRNMIATKEAGLAADKGYRESSGGKLVQGEVDALKQRLAFLAETERMNARSVEQGAEKVKQTEAQIAFDQLTGKHLQNESKLRDGIALAQERLAAAQKGASPEQQAANLAKYTQAVKDLQEAYKPKEAPRAKAEKIDPYVQLVNELKQAEQLAEREQELSAKSAQSDKVRLTSLYRVVDLYNLKKISVQQLLAAEELIEEVYQKQSGAEKSIAAGKEAVKVHNEYINSLKSSAKAIEDKEVALRDEVKAYDLSIAKNISLAEAVDLVAVSRLEEQRIVQMSFGDDAAVTQIEREIEARKRLADSIWQQDAHKKQIQSAKDVKAEWKKTAESITNSLVDSFMQSTDEGTTRFAKMRNDVEQMFKRMALNFVINAVVNAAGQVVGVGGSGGDGGSGGGMGVTGAYSAAKGGYDAVTGGSAWMRDFGGGVTSSISSFGNTLSQSTNATLSGFGKDIIDFANTPNLASNLNIIGDALGYVNAASLFSQGKYGAAIGSAVGTFFGGPLGAMIGEKVGGLFGNQDRPTASTGDASVTFDPTGQATKRAQASDYRWGGNISKQADDFAVGLNKTYLDVANRLGIVAADTVFSYSGNTGKNGENPNFGLTGRVAGKEAYLSGGGAEQTYSAAALQLEASRAVFTALQGSELPRYLQGAFDNLVAANMSQEQLDTLMQTAQGVKQLHEQLQLLPFEALKDLSYAASIGLVKAAGGLDKLGTNLGTYYDKFYSSEEKKALLAKNTEAAFGALGLTMPKLDDSARANYRTMLEELAAKDLSVEANAKAYAGALALAAALDQLAPALVDTAKAAADAAKVQLDSLNKQASNAVSALEKAIAAEKEKLSAAYDEQAVSFNGKLDAVANSVGKLETFSSKLKTTISGLSVVGYDEIQRKQAQAQISGAVLQAKGGGKLPLAGELDNALQIIAKPSAQLFSSFEDYVKDFYATSNSIQDLVGVSDTQLTEAQATQAVLKAQLAALNTAHTEDLRRLDAIATLAQKQLDAANGIDTSILSVAASLKEFNSVLAKLVAEKDKQAADAAAAAKPPQAKTPTVGVGGGGGGTSPSYYSSKDYYLETALSGYGSVHSKVTDSAAISRLDSVKTYIETLDWSSAEAKQQSAILLASVAKQYGVSQQELAAAAHLPLADVKALFTESGIKSFAVGTSYVPYDMKANIHAGEEITPRPYVDAQRAARDETNELLRRLLDVNARSEADMAKMREDIEKLRDTNKRLSDLAERDETIGLPPTRTA